MGLGHGVTQSGPVPTVARDRGGGRGDPPVAQHGRWIAQAHLDRTPGPQIGEALGVTESRISQVHTKAVLQLRSRLAAAGMA